jgi:hypothetical protein
MTENVKLNDGFTQVCVWEATIVGKDHIQAFEQFVMDELGTRAQFLEEISTLPDMNMNGYPDPETGGRNDVLFAIHKGDIMKFAIPRFQYGMRWIEDIYGNGNGHLYPDRVREYKTW